MIQRGTVGLVINSPGLDAGASDMMTSWTSQIGLAIGYRDDISSVWLNTPAGRSQPVLADQRIPPSIAMTLGDMLFPLREKNIVLYTGNVVRSFENPSKMEIIDPSHHEQFDLLTSVVRLYKVFCGITHVALDFAGGTSTGQRAIDEYGLVPTSLGVNRLSRAFLWSGILSHHAHVETIVEAVPTDETGMNISPAERPWQLSVCLSRFIRNNEAKLRRITGNPSAQWSATNRITIWHRGSDENTDVEIRSWRDRGYNMIVPANQQPEIERVLRIYGET